MNHPKEQGTYLDDSGVNVTYSRITYTVRAEEDVITCRVTLLAGATTLQTRDLNFKVFAGGETVRATSQIFKLGTTSKCFWKKMFFRAPFANK